MEVGQYLAKKIEAFEVIQAGFPRSSPSSQLLRDIRSQIDSIFYQETLNHLRFFFPRIRGLESRRIAAMSTARISNNI
jgi:hypothetical protein